jgi:hypothetical protein
MPRPRKAKGPKSAFDQIKEIAPEWADNVLTLKDEELKNMLARLELECKQIEEAKKADPDLPTMTEQLKALRETYTVPLKTNRLKQRIAAVLLEERGKA